MAKSFDAQVDEWVTKTLKRMEAVHKESIQRTIDIMQLPYAKGGNMRIDTGFNRASLVTTLNAPATTVTFNPLNQAATTDENSVALTISKAKLGQPVYAMYTANYAVYREYKDGFVEHAAGRWQETVNQVAREAKRR